MKLLLTAISFIVIGFFSGCHKNDNPVSTTDISGTYRYYGYDMQNNLVTTGTLNIVVNGKQITGTKDLSGGLEDGKGEITGVIDDNNNFFIHLRPNEYAEIILKGNLSGGFITGARLFITASRITYANTGTFNASKETL